jgi:serine/threonine protein kinase
MLLELARTRQNSPWPSATDAESSSMALVPIATRATREDRSGHLVAGRYRILRRLGQGGMGSVWFAVDNVLTRAVALKELREPAEDPRGGGHALREARAASVVSHPGVVQVFDVVVDDCREWIVMEALTGTTLRQAIRDAGSLPPERLLAVGLGLLDALQALHREGVVHGDVKPGNVQLTETGQPVLTDFGLASGTAPAAVGASPFVTGSPPYMAPEVIRGGPRGVASDCFSLGATLYEAAVGRRPFEGATPVESATAVLSHSPPPPLQAAPLGRVIESLLVKDPRRRLGVEMALAWLREIASDLKGPVAPTGVVTSAVT